MFNTTHLNVRSRFPLDRIVHVLAFVLCVAGCNRPAEDWRVQLKNPSLTEKQFTRAVANAIREEIPAAQTTIVAPLEIKITGVSDIRCYLDNTWKESRGDGDSKVEAVTRYINSMKASLALMADDRPRNIEDVVPIIKDREWVEQATVQASDNDSVYHEPLVGDILVVYAEDGENQLAYLTKSEADGFELSAEQLRKTALKNLHTRLPETKLHGDSPPYMVTAGGTFEASLLLMSNLWDQLEEVADGRLVVAVPSRDVLMFAGENSKDALKEMKSAIDEIHADGGYLISKTMLIRRGKNWETFTFP